MMKKISEIQRKISERRALVMTAEEFKERVRAGNRPTLEEVDVVTTGTFGVVSGTLAVLSVPVCGPNEFKHAVSVTLNGIPANIGPCPNESLGIVDLVVNGTARADGCYGGGHLFRDLVAGEAVAIHVEGDNGRVIDVERTLSEIPYARMITTRSFFRNYSCFATAGGCVDTIFCGPRPMNGSFSEATVSGCGEMNPVQNDPHLRFLRPGAGVFVNGAQGMVLGTGTRSSPAKPNLSVVADMHDMRPEFMGGFKTSIGPECTISVGAAIPVLDETTLDELSVLDGEVALPLGDVRDRIPVFSDTYSSVWHDGNDLVGERRDRCLGCDDCQVDANCPRGAHPASGIDRTLCMDCGMCAATCRNGVFFCDSGKVRFGDRDVPIVQRQSSRRIGQKVCEEIKSKVQNGTWSMGLYNEWI